MTRDAVEIGYYHFATYIKGQDFAPAAHYMQRGLPVVTSGYTNLGHTINTVLDRFEQRVDLLRRNGIGVRPGVMVLLTDGEATDCLDDPVARLVRMQRDERFEVLPIAVDPEHAGTLQRVFHTPAICLDQFDFAQFFRSLAGAISVSSQSQLGYEPSVPLLIEQQTQQAQRMVRFVPKPDNDDKSASPTETTFRRLPQIDGPSSSEESPQ
ncbi:MAG: hypothetical protein R3C28_25970 [Pirellulaceae bacterium]